MKSSPVAKYTQTKVTPKESEHFVETLWEDSCVPVYQLPVLCSCMCKFGMDIKVDPSSKNLVSSAGVRTEVAVPNFGY
eukprot:1390258-Amphidinium_carterae.1